MTPEASTLDFSIHLTNPDNYWLFCVSVDGKVRSAYIAIPDDVVQYYKNSPSSLITVVRGIVNTTMQNYGIQPNPDCRVFMYSSKQDVTSNTLEDIDKLQDALTNYTAAVPGKIIQLFVYAFMEYNALRSRLGAVEMEELPTELRYN